MSEQHDADQPKEPLLPVGNEPAPTAASESKVELKESSSDTPVLSTGSSSDASSDASIGSPSDASSARLLPATTESVKDDHLPAKSEPSKTLVAPDKFETEWIPGEHLELIRIPPPTIWPATLALGTTGMAFGVVTHWILSVAGLFLFLLGAAGWIEDLRKDVLQ